MPSVASLAFFTHSLHFCLSLLSSVSHPPSTHTASFEADCPALPHPLFICLSAVAVPAVTPSFPFLPSSPRSPHFLVCLLNSLHLTPSTYSTSTQVDCRMQLHPLYSYSCFAAASVPAGSRSSLFHASSLRSLHSLITLPNSLQHSPSTHTPSAQVDC